MQKYSKKEVKEHFRNARKVRCLSRCKDVYVNPNDFWDGMTDSGCVYIWLDKEKEGSDSSAFVYDSDTGRMAEIIERTD